jgi:Tol biopolymer transport system component/DNA-binding winged helix-turn-helix (wHTH) protein
METLTAKNFRFSNFELDGVRRLLLKDGEPVALNPKAFDLLLTLVESRGEVLSKDDLLARVWPGQFIEEGNLKVHISALRKVFQESKNDHRYIVTVPGRGYSFVAELDEPTNGEIVIESHSLSRILVEETIEGGTERKETENEATVKQISSSPRPRLTASQKLGIGIFVGIIVLGGAAAWIDSSRNAAPNQLGSTTNTSGRQLAAKIFTTTGGGIPTRVAISPDGKTLVYSEHIKGQFSLRLGDIESNNSVEIVPYSDRHYDHLVFAPDGKNVYFTFRDAIHPRPILMRVSILGGAVRELIQEVNGSLTFSPDGKSLAFFRHDPNASRTSLIIANAETGKDERVLTIQEKPENIVGSGVSWSPDGQRVVFAASDPEGKGTTLLSASTADGRITKIGKTVGNRIVNIAWLADGSGLIVNRNSSNDASDGQIWFVPYPHGEAQPITNDSLSYAGSSLSLSSNNKLVTVQTRVDPQIRMGACGDLPNSEKILDGSRSRAEGMHGLAAAPDGKIVFTAKTTDGRTIWEIDANGGNQRQLTPPQKDVEDRQINVTADNRFLVFDSNRSGSAEIWRANRDGSDLRALTNGGGNIQPAVSPDGLWVVYIALRDGKYGLRRVSIDGGEPIPITTEESAWPAISPDGRFIAIARVSSNENSSRVINVIPFEGGATVKTFEVPFNAVLYNRLRWSPDGKAIIYKDNFQGLWRQWLSKGEPEAVSCPEDMRIYHFAYSADGNLVYSGGVPMREIVILENFR